MKTDNKVLFDIKSPTIRVLRYASFRKRDITPVEVRDFFPHLFKKPYNARESMQRLENHKFLENTGNDLWKLTDTGLKYLRSSAPIYKGENAHWD